MRGKLVGMVILAGLGVAFALSFGSAQDRSGPPPALPLAPARFVPPQETKPIPREVAKYSLLERQAFLSGQRGADWLQRANRPDGRFVYGFLPDLRTTMEGDNYFQQVGAAFALARAARFYGDEKAAAIARQALLTALLDTSIDPKAADVRHTTLPSTLVNRLGAAGMLVVAIHELPAPEKDLLEQADQLCNYIRRQQRADGSVSTADSNGDSGGSEAGGGNYFPGPALYALIRSNQHQPASWKIDAVRKALPYYSKWWREHKNLAMVPWQTAASTEAYLATREQAFADAVFEMNDWLCGLQYNQLDARKPLWLGGFKGWRDGKESMEAPEIASADYAASLVDACRAARQAGDVRRLQRYREAVERCLQFLATLQYTDSNTQHYADWYRPVLVGAFHASHQDGNLRLDHTYRAVAAQVQFLDQLAGQP